MASITANTIHIKLNLSGAISLPGHRLYPYQPNMTNPKIKKKHIYFIPTVSITKNDIKDQWRW